MSLRRLAEFQKIKLESTINYLNYIKLHIKIFVSEDSKAIACRQI